MKTISTLLFCASLVPALAMGMDSPPEEPEQENRMGDRSDRQREDAMGGPKDRGHDGDRKGNYEKGHANLDTTSEGFLNSTPSRAISVDSLMGNSVRTRDDDEEIGEVEDILIGPNGQPLAVVVAVGGFLGMGEKDVALSFEKVRVAYAEDDGGWFESDDSPGAGSATGAAGRQNATGRDGVSIDDWSPGDYIIIVDTDREALEQAPEFEREWDM